MEKSSMRYVCERENEHTRAEALEELVCLQHLRSLSLSDGFLQGSETAALGVLTHLTSLAVICCGFGGTACLASISHLVHLESLRIMGTPLSSALPVDILPSFQPLANLKVSLENDKHLEL